MSEKEIEKNIIYALIVKNDLKDSYDWNAM